MKISFNDNHLVRSDSVSDIEISKNKGSYIIDTGGKKYIDFFTGWCVGNLGWGNNNIKKAIRNYKGPDYVYPGFIYQPWEELASLLCSIAPGNMDKCYRTTGGSESVEAALQIAMSYTGRGKFLSVENAYHGNTIGGLSVGATEERQKLHLLPGCLKIDVPLEDNAIQKLETKLRTKEIAAFILEPVICNIGVHIPSKNFMQAARKLCTRYGTLLIMDEVATGFGRTGKLFATEHFDIKPDIICLGKAITGGYAGMGATLTTNKIYKKVKDNVSIYSTYGWHPVSVEVALANVNFMLDRKESFFSNVASASQLFRTNLSQMDFKKKGKLNMIGLAIGVEVGDAKYAEAIMKKCFENGLLITTQEDSIVMFPPLTVEKKTILKAMDILESCI
jgi:adenosylmethionine-8-amino-7-oxononanoate aminotransferase